MKLTVTIDPTTPETEVSVRAPELTAEVRAIQTLAGKGQLRRIVGTRGTDAVVLDLAEILAFSTKDRTVVAHTSRGEWRVKTRIGELAEQLPTAEFVQISQSEIVSLRAISHLDLSATGTISVQLRDGSRYFVARRALKSFRAALGL
ncbi:DNA-binding LytR/AlgR family response regulator [Arcanobacterium wilhelmae]|uniref:DNA-binding LytR/AlgR family response regulator n=1 Tax=Arcanobacterium wilhelmae TaxID=1803177 RepID=A0ABT9NBS5_9ACTO|nr:LytTR family DNA-binding domain-containing protein [Arcanobacterium wilhelmae]MDP9800940.1 DNA-binding LytR/AlgR family response regulator [Arcanobacterium wilhelmae]WFN90300.1 LytTR family DNA-binding domain-containing protein [Arcanobacterium wilhelmae]